MSYILDALKRSQQEYQLDKAPTLFKEPHVEKAPRQSTNRTVLISLTFALLAILISLYTAFGSRFFVDESERPVASEPVATPPAGTPLVNEIEQALPAEKRLASTIEPVAANNKEKPVIAQKQRSAPVLEESIVDTGAEAVEDEPVVAPADTESDPVAYRQELLELKQRLDQQDKVITPYSETERVSAKESIPASTEPEREQQRETDRPISEQQLAAEFRSRLPGRVISVHVYSAKPQERFVFVNAHKMREGERTSEGLGVEEIHPDGIVFSFEGKRFFKRL